MRRRELLIFGALLASTGATFAQSATTPTISTAGGGVRNGSVASFKPTSASLVYYVSDIVQTETFYKEHLGLELQRMEGAEPFWLQGSLEGGLELIFFQQNGMSGNTPAIVFSVSDGGIDDLVADLAAKGVTIVTPVSEAPGGWSADFLDPDGFSVGFWQSEDLPRSLR